MHDKYVTDTHGLYWYLTASPKLGANARVIFEHADGSECIIFIPSLVMAELLRLANPSSQSRPSDSAKSKIFIAIPL